jgi:hypothetical protein
VSQQNLKFKFIVFATQVNEESYASLTDETRKMAAAKKK